MTLLLKSYGFQGRVETHINWGRTNACNGKLIWYYIWNVCGLGNGNLQQQSYVGLMTSEKLRGTDDVRNQSQRVHINWIKDHLDDETGCEVETVDGAVCSS